MIRIIADIAAEHVNWSEVIPIGITAALIILILHSILNDHLKK